MNTWCGCVDVYRYGFNGKENDNEIKGEGNQQDYGMRIYDPRIAKFLSVDPITAKYPELTPYQFASNRPIDGIDLDGLEFTKPPNPKATTLLITDPGTQVENRDMYNAAMGNRKIDVLFVDNIRDIPKYLKDVDTKYETVLFANHGSYEGAAQMIGRFTYNEEQLANSASSVGSLTRNMAEGGKVVLLGCFCAAPQVNGENYIKTFSSIVQRNVIANQGETFLLSGTFKWEPLGGYVNNHRPDLPPPPYQKMAIENAGKWSEAKPDGTMTPNIGNVMLDNNGKPMTRMPIPPLKPDNKPLPTWQSTFE